MAIAGGIGGPTLALARGQRGMAAEVFEQAAALTEIGAAVASSANAIRELERLGHRLTGIAEEGDALSLTFASGWRARARYSAPRG